MVVFICGSCNEALKKNGIATHLNRCRSAVISCCDCNKEFTDDSYSKHVQCISEDSKYGPEEKRVFGNQDKGKAKQDAWFNNIKEYLKENKITGKVEMALNKLLEHPNIPRKKNKFMNFAKSCLHPGIHEEIDKLWEICESANKAVDAKEKSLDDSNIVVPKEEPTNDNKEQTEDKKKDKKKKKKGTDDQSGDAVTTSADEKSEKSQVQDKENSDQSNAESGKKSKKKKKSDVKQEEETNGTEKDGDQEKNNSTSADAVPETEENNDQSGDNLKKKSKKKKKRDISESIGDNDQQSSDQKDSNVESDSKKRKVAEEPTKEDQMETDQNSGANETLDDSKNPINWFKQLKRQIKEKETVEIKDLKKMVKKLKKEHDLAEDLPELVTKAKGKLMKRHNYSISEGQIKYLRLF